MPAARSRRQEPRPPFPGTEYRVHKNITVGAGYDYIDLGSKQHVGGISGPSITAANQVVHTVPAEIHMVTGRVNFLFGWN